MITIDYTRSNDNSTTVEYNMKTLDGRLAVRFCKIDPAFDNWMYLSKDDDLEGMPNEGGWIEGPSLSFLECLKEAHIFLGVIEPQTFN